MAKHHFVPQTYLRGFATDDDSERVYFYDRRIASKGATKRLIEDVCSQNNLYEIIMDDGSGAKKSDDLEKAFATVAEPTFKAIVTKLLARTPLTREEKSEFAAYISLQVMRTPATRELYNSLSTAIWDAEAKKQWAKLLDDTERERVIKELKEESGVDASKLTKQDIHNIIDGNGVETTWTIPKENWVKDVTEIMGEVYPALEKMHWRVYFAPKGTAFITSDNPVGILVHKPDGYYAGTGILNPGSIRLFPLTKYACLSITDDEPAGFSFADADKKRVQQINGVTAVSYHNILIGHNQQLVARSIKRSKGLNMIKTVSKMQIEEMQLAEAMS